MINSSFVNRCSVFDIYYQTIKQNKFSFLPDSLGSEEFRVVGQGQKKRGPF